MQYSRKSRLWWRRVLEREKKKRTSLTMNEYFNIREISPKSRMSEWKCLTYLRLWMSETIHLKRQSYKYQNILKVVLSFVKLVHSFEQLQISSINGKKNVTTFSQLNQGIVSSYTPRKPRAHFSKRINSLRAQKHTSTEEMSAWSSYVSLYFWCQSEVPTVQIEQTNNKYSSKNQKRFN